MIAAARFRVHAARRQALERLFIEPISIAELPGARDDGRHPIVAMRMSRNGGIRRNRQNDGVEPRFRRISRKDFGAHASEQGTSNLLRSSLVRAEFIGRQAHLGER